MPSSSDATNHRVPRLLLLRLLTASVTLLLLLCLGCTVPRFVLSDGTERWDGPQQEASRLARTQLRGDLGPLQVLATTQIRVIDVLPDPSGCAWDAPASPNTTGIVRLQTYTLFGVPAQQWTVTCNASWSSWEPRQ